MASAKQFGAIIELISPAVVCATFVLCSDVNSGCHSRGASCSGEPNRKAGVGRKRDRGDPVNPCAEFNSFQWRMSYASRKKECNALDSCVFIGRSITGACAPRDPSILLERGSGKDLAKVPLVLPDKDADERKAALERRHAAKKIEETIDELETELEEEEDGQLAARRFQAAMDSLDVEQATQDMALAILKEEGMAAVQVFVQSQLANAAAEELRCQKASTEAFAKDFLIQVLRNERLPGHFGKMLERVFKDPSLSKGIRELIYTAIALDHTFRSSLKLTRPLVTWLLTGTDWMDEQTLRLCVYIIGLEQTELATIWLVAWAIGNPGMLDQPVSRALAQSIPLGSEEVSKAITKVSVDALQSDWALELVKTTTLDILQRSANKDGMGQAPPTGTFQGASGGDTADDDSRSAGDGRLPQDSRVGGRAGEAFGEELVRREESGVVPGGQDTAGKKPASSTSA